MAKAKLIKQDLLQNKYFIFFIILALFLLRLLWVGDAPFINDEPRFLDLGYQFSKTKDFFILGLEGKTGVKYGPYTSWFFGLLFLISKDLIIITYLKTFIVSLMTLIGGSWIISEVKGFKSFYLIPLFTSLYLFNYSRILWDLNISLTLLALASYISFIKKEDFWKILLCALFCTFSLLTHLMSLPLILSLGIHLLLYKRNWIKKNPLLVLITLTCILFIGGRYFNYVLTVKKNSSGFLGTSRSFFYALFGARFFTTFDFSYFLGKGWQELSFLPFPFNKGSIFLSFLTWLPYPVSWYGLYLSIKKFSRPKESLNDHIMFIGAIIVIFHLFLSFVSGLRTHPHYYDGAWTGMLLMFWIGLNHLKNSPRFLSLFKVYLTSSIFYLLIFIFIIHSNSGSRSLHYGPTLLNQINIVKEIKKRPYANFSYQAFHPKTFPHTFNFIAKLLPERSPLKEDKHDYVIDYQSTDKRNGEITLLKTIK